MPSLPGSRPTLPRSLNYSEIYQSLQKDVQTGFKVSML
jgi:hypothetical protein